MNIILQKRGLPEISILDYQSKFCFPLEKYYKNLGFDFKKEPYLVPSLEFIALYGKEKYRPKLYPEIIKILHQLRKCSIKNYLLSAQNHDSLLELISFYQIGPLFEKIQGTDNLHARGKQKLASKLLKSCEINRSEVLFIGDTNMDVKIAVANNAPILGLTFGHQSRERFLKSDKLTLIDTFRDLNAYLALKFWENQ